MAVTPSPALRTTISYPHWQTGMRWWLGLPLVDSSSPTCPHCQQPSDPLGDHAVCCKRCSFYDRHSAVQLFLCDSLQEGKQPFTREVELDRHNRSCRNGRRLRPADILLAHWDGGKDLALDVTVSHPCQLSEIPCSEDKARSFLNRKEKKKQDKYNQPCDLQGWSFQAAAWDTWSGHSFATSKLLNRILKRATASLDPAIQSSRR